MNKYTIISILIIAIALFSGCTGTDKEVYKSTQTNEILTLYNDNTVTITNRSDYDLAGAYKRDGDRIITIWPPFGTTVLYTKKGNKLIWESKGNKEEWVRI